MDEAQTEMAAKRPRLAEALVMPVLQGEGPTPTQGRWRQAGQR